MEHSPSFWKTAPQGRVPSQQMYLQQLFEYTYNNTQNSFNFLHLSMYSSLDRTPHTSWPPDHRNKYAQQISKPYLKVGAYCTSNNLWLYISVGREGSGTLPMWELLHPCTQWQPNKVASGKAGNGNENENGSGIGKCVTNHVQLGTTTRLANLFNATIQFATCWSLWRTSAEK